MAISPSEKAIARHLEDVFRGRPRIVPHREGEEGSFQVGIARIAGYPFPGQVTLSTIGVSNSPLYLADGSEHLSTRVEFIASCREGQEEDLEEALFVAAAFSSKRRGPARPGIFLSDLIGRFRPSSPVPHGFLTLPFAYEEVGRTKEFAGRIVSWLQVVPVPANEITYAQDRSIDALETLFETADVEWDNLDRASVV